MILFSTIGQAALPDVAKIVHHLDRLWRGNTSHGQLTMTVKTQHYSRSMTLESWSQGLDKSLVVVRAPKKDAGIATLKVDKNIWNYLPKINRVIRVPESMMSGSWMGSHFTNDDLVKENSFEEDYTAHVESIEEGVIHLVFVPKENAPVVWGRVDMWLNEGDWVPIRATYYDEEMTKVRTMTFSSPKMIGGRKVPMIMRLQPENKPDEFTELQYHQLDFNVDLPDNLFSLRALKSAH